MNRIIKSLLMSLGVAAVVLTQSAWSASLEGIEFEPVEVRLNDKVSLRNGAGLFVQNCMSCHGAKFMRYNRLADDLGIPEDVMIEAGWLGQNLRFGDRMETNMSSEDGALWFGVAPPDLSLIGRLRSPEYLHAYFKGFYRDPDSFTGWNNRVFPNVGMPHVLANMQGIQEPVYEDVTTENGDVQQKLVGLRLVEAGTMTEEQFDKAMYDLTNFLVYMGEPAKLVRYKYGVWTIAFLILFAFVAYLLKKEYWKDVH